jgi:hypothetical protein
MLTFFSVLVLCASVLVLILLMAATYHYLPKGDVHNMPIQFARNYTDWLRSPKGGPKILYWAIPISILLLSNLLAGIILLIAAYIGVVFNRRFMQMAGLADPQPN